MRIHPIEHTSPFVSVAPGHGSSPDHLPLLWPWAEHPIPVLCYNECTPPAHLCNHQTPPNLHFCSRHSTSPLPAGQTMDSTQPLEMRGQQEVDGVANQMEETTGYDGNQMDETGRDDTYLTARGSIQTTRTIGHVGAAPSSLAGLAKGKKYFVDPYTPFTPRPATLSTRDMMIGPPMSTYRSNHWITQTSPAYIPRRLQNHRIPRTPPEIKRGFPATGVCVCVCVCAAFARVGYAKARWRTRKSCMASRACLCNCRFARGGVFSLRWGLAR